MEAVVDANHRLSLRQTRSAGARLGGMRARTVRKPVPRTVAKKVSLLKVYSSVILVRIESHKDLCSEMEKVYKEKKKLSSSECGDVLHITRSKTVFEFLRQAHFTLSHGSATRYIDLLQNCPCFGGLPPRWRVHSKYASSRGAIGPAKSQLSQSDAMVGSFPLVCRDSEHT